jgi:hypothetical protein
LFFFLRLKESAQQQEEEEEEDKDKDLELSSKCSTHVPRDLNVATNLDESKFHNKTNKNKKKL